MITSAQIRGARAMLGLKQAELAERAGISKTGLINIENGSSDPKASTLTAIRRALEAAGVIFVEENGDGPGVKLRKSAKVEEISQQIDALEDKISSIPAPTEPSPEAGMNTMRKAVAENNLKTLKNRRTRITRRDHSK